MQQQKFDVQAQYVKDAKRTEPDYGPVVERLANPEMARLLHVAMGLVTEAAEFVDQLKRHLFYGARVDTTNLLEELGDITWYQRIAVDELRSSLLDILDRNVAKLRARFPEKFTEDKAVNRDLDAERAVLECSGPLPGRDVTVVQTPNKTLFVKTERIRTVWPVTCPYCQMTHREGEYCPCPKAQAARQAAEDIQYPRDLDCQGVSADGGRGKVSL